MYVKPPGTEKSHPSSCAETMPAQLPCVLKPSAVIGVGVFGSSGTWYASPRAAAEPAPTRKKTATATAPTAATTPACHHAFRRAALLNTGCLPRSPPFRPYLIGKGRRKYSIGAYDRIR